MAGKYRNRRRSFRSRFRKSARRVFRKSAVRGIARAVKRLQKESRRSHQIALFQRKITTDVATVGPAIIHNLSDHASNTLQPVFGTGFAATASQRAIHHKIRMDCYVDLENQGGVNEEGPIEFTAYIVSLKDDIGTAFNSATGAISLTSGAEYVINDAAVGVGGGYAFLNTKKFRIHKMKKFVLSNHEQGLGIASAQTQYGTNMRWSWVIRPRVFVRSLTTLGLSTMTSSVDPSKCYYFLLFHNNSVVDAESPRFNLSTLHTYVIQ